jgi:hypothetical protein
MLFHLPDKCQFLVVPSTVPNGRFSTLSRHDQVRPIAAITSTVHHHQIMKFIEPVSGRMDLVARLLMLAAAILSFTDVMVDGDEWMSWLTLTLILVALLCWFLAPPKASQ